MTDHREPRCTCGECNWCKGQKYLGMVGRCGPDCGCKTQTDEYNELSESTKKALEYHKAYLEGREIPSYDELDLPAGPATAHATMRDRDGFGSTGGFNKPEEKFCKTPEELKAAREEGLKYDTGKIRTDLLPVYPLLQVAMVLTFGAIKYGDRNWEQGIAFGRMYGAALRHIFAWWNGEDLDPESGLHHLAHASCCLLMALQYTMANREYDDRPSRVISPS